MKLLTANGKTQRISDWSKETGIPAGTIDYRVSVLGWTHSEAVNTPAREPKHGKPLRQIARDSGVPFGTLAARLNRGWTIEEAITGKRAKAQ
jgi:hypothetical protein